jgi:transcriptional regulator with XRE-family HTH domain
VSRRAVDVKGLRRRLGLSQEELAAKIAAGVRSVRRWESDPKVRPTQAVLANLKRLAEEADRRETRAPEAPAERMAPRTPPPARRRIPVPAHASAEHDSDTDESLNFGIL